MQKIRWETYCFPAEWSLSHESPGPAPICHPITFGGGEYITVPLPKIKQNKISAGHMATLCPLCTRPLPTAVEMRAGGPLTTLMTWLPRQARPWQQHQCRCLWGPKLGLPLVLRGREHCLSLPHQGFLSGSSRFQEREQGY